MPTAKDQKKSQTPSETGTQLSEYQLKQKAKHAAEQTKQQEEHAKQQAEQQEEEIARLLESFKKSSAAFYQLNDDFNRFNLQWPDKSENFPAYENQYVGSHVISQLRVVANKLLHLLQEMAALAEKLNSLNSGSIFPLDIDFAYYNEKLIALNTCLDNYEAAAGNNNYLARFKVYKPVAELVQHLQYKLQFSLIAALKIFNNPKKNAEPAAPPVVPPGLQSLPADILRKISLDYLSVKDVVNLASTKAGFFFNKEQSNNINFNLLAKHKRLLELKDLKYFSDSGCVFLLEPNKLYAYGINPCGQLGVGDYLNRKVPAEIDLNRLKLASGDKIMQVFEGSDYTIFLTEQGRCFTCGGNFSGQLGVGDNRDRNVLTEIDLNRLNLAPGDKIKQVFIGHNYTIFLTKQGRCFTCGGNFSGQLGVGDNRDRNVPTEVDLNRLNLAPGDKIKQVIMGVAHTIFLTEQGRCFACGKNFDGELGVGDYQTRNVPTEIDLNRLNLAPGDKIKQVIMGVAYTILLTEQGRCFACGSNFGDELGVGDYQNRNVPTEIDLNRLNLAPGDKIKQVFSRHNYTIFLTEQGRCFACGNNYYGQLGVGDYRSRNVPTDIDLNRLNLVPGDKIKHVIMGFDSTLFLTEHGWCFACGRITKTNTLTDINFTLLNLALTDKVTQVFDDDIPRAFIPRVFISEQGRIIVNNTARKKELCVESKFFEINQSQLQLMPWDKVQKIEILGDSLIIITEYNRIFDFKINRHDPSKSILEEVTMQTAREKHHLINSIVNDISQLAVFANKKTDYGVNFKQILLSKAKLLPYAWLHESFLDELQELGIADVQKELMTSMHKLMNIYNYFVDKKPTDDLIIRQKDFVELLQILSKGDITNYEQLDNYLQKTASERRLKNIAEFRIFDLQLDLPHHSTRYYDARQKLLEHTQSESQNTYVAFACLKIAATIILQGLKSATQEDKMAFALQSLINTTLLSTQVLQNNTHKIKK